MKIVLCHNFYQQPGGEDRVLQDESDLLTANGHEVVHFTKHSSDIEQMSKLAVARRAIWNRAAAAELRELVRRERADIVHFHNTVPLISPAAYYAAREAGAGVVQTLHNYRLICPKATFFRDGGVCESCLGKLFPWPAIQHGCYRDSRAGSAVMATMLTTHRLLKTYKKAVDCYIALSEFSRKKYIESGLPEDKIALKPNFVSPDPGEGDGLGAYAMYLGRLSPEKGVEMLLEAWKDLDVPLKLVGNGPLGPAVEQEAAQNPNIQWLAGQSDQQVRDIMGDATLFVLPSVNFEGFPKTIVEAFSLGTPVVASRLGAMAELIDDGRTGKHFKPGDPEDLAREVQLLWANQARLREMRSEARAEYEDKYTAESNYRTLFKIYERVLHSAASRKSLSTEEVLAT